MPLFEFPEIRICNWHHSAARVIIRAASVFDKAMSDENRFTIVCPSCEATLTIDADTGTLLSHDEKHKALGSFEDMVKDLDKQKQTREQIFTQEMSSHKDRS